ncbi:unnamed protein product [Withania somnifera]
MSNTPFVISFALLLSFPLLFLFAPRIFPSKHVEISIPDELDDLALFRRATLASVDGVGGAISRLGTTNPRMRIAFLFLTNTNLHFSPLWDRFFGGHDSFFNIYIHADPSLRFRHLKDESSRVVSSRPKNPTCIPYTYIRRSTSYGDRPFRRPVKFLFCPCITIFFIQILSNESYMWDRYIARGKSAMLPEVPFDRFRFGSQFFVLTRRHALVVIRDRRLWRKFRMPCLNEDSCYPEEHYFPTLLSMEDPKGCTQYTLTRVNWTESVNGHPPPESNSTYSHMFARKFSPDCLKPLMDIADKVIFRIKSGMLLF